MDSYYESTAGALRPAPLPLRGHIETDVCIVGAGFAGLATALGLIERGRRDVVVLESQRVGFGASGRNGGFVFGGYSLDCSDLLAQLGPDRARACYALTRKAVDLIRRRIRNHGIACDIVEGGALLANWFDDESILLNQQRLMADHFGVQWQLIRKAELDAHVRSDRYFGALLEPDAFHFHPLKYALGEAEAVRVSGGRIHEESPVTSITRAITRKDSGYVVTTPHGSVQARHVVVAGGGYLNGLVPAIERAMLPIATYVMVTEPLGALQRELIPSPAAIYDTRFAFDYYRVLNDTRILWGGRIAIRDRHPEDIAEFLKRDMMRVYPRLAGAKVEFAWSGMMSYARHKMPQIGKLPSGDQAGAWYALSFGGHGVAPTTVAGEVLAAAIAENAPIPDGFAPYGLPRTFGPLGLAAAQATYSWFETKDWFRAL